MDYCVKD